MGFKKIKTIRVSEMVFDLVCSALDEEQLYAGAKINGYLECFNNCREQGYVLTAYSTDYGRKNRPCDFRVWACEARSSDDIRVIWDDYRPQGPTSASYGEEAYAKNSKRFRYDEFFAAADYIVNLVKERFGRGEIRKRVYEAA